MTTQRERILAHLKSGRSIDPFEALSAFGCYRLGARIHDLRVDGYRINTVLVDRVNRFGNACRVALYTLEAG